MASSLPVPAQPQLSVTTITSRSTPASPVLEARALDPAKDETPIEASSADDTLKADKAFFGDWVGTWWVKGKAKAPRIPFPENSDSESIKGNSTLR